MKTLTTPTITVLPVASYTKLEREQMVAEVRRAINRWIYGA